MRKTLKQKISFSGVGLHTGKKSKIELHPLKQPGGIVFLINGIKIPAKLSYKKDSRRGTILKKDNQSVETVEHILSSLYAMNIDDCIIEVSKGNEVPIMDGSNYPFIKKIIKIGILKKNQKREIVEINNEIKYNKDDVEIIGKPYEGFKINFLFDGKKFGYKKEEMTFLLTEKNYIEKIARARTFGFWQEIEYLKENNYAKGADLNNVLVIKNGNPYKNSFRFKKELVAHKILDFIGDLSLVGKRVMGFFKVKRSGHYHNGRFFKKILEDMNE